MAPTAGDAAFVDTNVLLTATDAGRPLHEDAQQFITESGRRGVRLAASGQILREYLVVATRPRETNGLGLSVPDAIRNLNEFLRCLHLCDETAEVARRLREIAATHRVRGRALHDANIVATMAAHGVRDLVTANVRDFVGFDAITTHAVGADR